MKDQYCNEIGWWFADLESESEVGISPPIAPVEESEIKFNYSVDYIYKLHGGAPISRYDI